MDFRGKNEKAAVGFEPTNNGFANRRLRPLGYAASQTSYYNMLTISNFITPEGIRTPNLRFRRPMLYPIELQAHINPSILIKILKSFNLFYEYFITISTNNCVFKAVPVNVKSHILKKNNNSVSGIADWHHYRSV